MRNTNPNSPEKKTTPVRATKPVRRFAEKLENRAMLTTTGFEVPVDDLVTDSPVEEVAAADTNADGLLSLEELSASLTEAGFENAETTANEIIDQLDTDDDELLSAEELEAADDLEDQEVENGDLENENNDEDELSDEEDDDELDDDELDEGEDEDEEDDDELDEEDDGDEEDDDEAESGAEDEEVDGDSSDDGDNVQETPTGSESDTADVAESPDSEQVPPTAGSPAVAAISSGIAGDINLDGAVDFADLIRMSDNFGKHVDYAFADGDLTGDRFVDFNDFLVLIANFGRRFG